MKQLNGSQPCARVSWDWIGTLSGWVGLGSKKDSLVMPGTTVFWKLCGFEPISDTVGFWEWGYKSFNRNWGIVGSRGPWEAEPSCKGSVVLTENQEFQSAKNVTLSHLIF